MFTDCEKYSKITNDCVHDPPPNGERKRALSKEYPHIVSCKKRTVYKLLNLECFIE